MTVRENAAGYTLGNGLVTAFVSKRSGALTSLTYQGIELLGTRHGADGAYWSSVGSGRIGGLQDAVMRINPATNGGDRAEVACRLRNDPRHPTAGLDAEYRYALGRGEHGIYVSAFFAHQPGYPAYAVAEARYCLKLNPAVFDYLTVDANRRRVMPTGYDWDHGVTMNMKEARRMTTGLYQGQVEHKYDYAAVLAETPAYGWSSSARQVGLWLVNPSIEYLGGGPTKVELTGHLDVNSGGLPTLLNMWVGSHYGGTVLQVKPAEAWTKTVGPFLLYCNSAPDPGAMWRDALAQAAKESAAWPYPWAADPDYPAAAQRGSVTGRLRLHDPPAPDERMSNVWVGVTAPDYLVPGSARSGMPPQVDWQRDAKFYQFWTRADAAGQFAIPHVRPGNYTLHAFADGVIGEYTLSNVTVAAGAPLDLGDQVWVPRRFGRTVWQIGIPDRTAREFRHGDHYWQWGLYFDYPKEFPQDVNYYVGRSDWRRDWNYVQPPRPEGRETTVTGEEEELREAPVMPPIGKVHSTTWTVHFPMTGHPQGQATLRLVFCGTHQGCNVAVSVNGTAVGETGTLPSTSAMQRDGIRAYVTERDIRFDAHQLRPGDNELKLTSSAHSWSQGVMYDCLRLELDDAPAGPP